MDEIMQIPHGTQTKNIESRLKELCDERDKLQAASADPLANVSLIFEKFKGTPVTFDVLVGEYFENKENTKAALILRDIFYEYTKLECYQEGLDEVKSYVMNQLQEGLQKKGQFGFTFDASNWRLYIGPLSAENNFNKILGFSARFFFNRGCYPTETFSEWSVKEQLRYRMALIKVEEAIINQKVDYTIRTK